jgi:hypothetical protein
MRLKPQDLVIALKLTAIGEQTWRYAPLASELFMSVSEVHAGVKRALQSRLLIQPGSASQPQPNFHAIEEFVVHGVKYAFPADHGGIVRGMKTSYAANLFDGIILYDARNPPVWPDAEGVDRGPSLSPLCKSVPRAATVDAKLYALLALVDAIRDGRARERTIAEQQFHQRLNHAT